MLLGFGGRLSQRTKTKTTTTTKRAAGMTFALHSHAKSLDECVLVRKAEAEEDITIRMLLPPTGQQRNMCRKKDEPIGKPLERIRRTVSSACFGKGGKAKGREAKKQRGDQAAAAFNDDTADLGVTCTMLDHLGHPVPETTTNSEAWQTGYTLELKYTTGREENSEVVSKKLKIETNLPGCSELALPRRIIAGQILTSPAWTLEFCSSADCKWSWFAEEEGGGWTTIGEGSPQLAIDEKFVGRRVKVRCEPACGERAGEPREAVSQAPVMNSPPLRFMRARHDAMGARPTGSSLRVMSYNILADVYSKTSYAKDVLYPDISKEHLDTDYRQQLSLFEVSGFGCDILCMQEVDSILYDKFWSPRLESGGYEGFFSPKTSKVEGCALFWNQEKLGARCTESVHLRDLFADEGWLEKHLGAEAASTLARDQNLWGILRKISTAAQYALLEVQQGGGRRILVANTHLYFHPGASHIRSLSVAAILAHAADLLSRHGLTEEDCPVLVCGDLNSEPDTGAIELLARSSVSAEHYEWRDCSRFSWKARDEESGFEQDEDLRYALDGVAGGGSEERYPRFDLRSPFGPLASSDGLRSAFTNYVKGYIGALDYIFYPPGKMGLEKLAPLPAERDLCSEDGLDSEGNVVAQGYLPSQSFPSDHVSIVADLSFLPGTAVEPPSLTWPPPGDRPVMPLPASRWNEGKAADALRRGLVVAVPTDTIYGVAASASSDEGIDRIYDAKRRPAFLPLALCIAHPSEIGRYGDASHLPAELVEKFLPGPYTLLLNRRDDSELSANLNPGTRTVGIRVPESSFVRGVVATLGFAIALTSANISGGSSSTKVGDFRELWDKCANVYDGGELNAGTSGSTIIDLSEPGVYRIVRKGCSEEEAHAILKEHGLREKETPPP